MDNFDVIDEMLIAETMMLRQRFMREAIDGIEITNSSFLHLYPVLVELIVQLRIKEHTSRSITN